MSKEVIYPHQFGHLRTNDTDDVPGVTEKNDEQKRELEILYGDFFSRHKKGKVVTGKVINVSSYGVLVDIQYKSESLIPRYEFSEYELKKLKAGDDLEVMLDELESVDGTLVLSYEKAKALKAWDAIIKLYEENKPVEGTVTHKIKGGLSVDIGIQAFLPGSQVDIQRVANFDQYINQKITANIIKVNRKRGNVIISRRKYLNELRSETRKKILETLDIEQVIQGTVKNITNYGVFIDIGGVDGLLHITDMTWGRISHPSELVKIGDTITVKVLSFDKENEKISLGTKQLTDNPWDALSDTIQIGSVVKGKISSITDYGLFVTISDGIEGLIHISEISWTDRISDLKRHFGIGDEVEARIIALDKENRRMSLSIKQLEKNPWETVLNEFKAGDQVSGSISNITDFGIFIQLKPGIDGLVHISDISWTEHIDHPSSIYQKQTVIEAVILSVDKENKKISLGIKQLNPNPWEEFAAESHVGSIVKAEVIKVTSAGATVKLETGIEGLVPSTEIPKESQLKIGETYEFKISTLNKNDQKLFLIMPNAPMDTIERPTSLTEKPAPNVTFVKPKSQIQIELEKLEREKNSKK